MAAAIRGRSVGGTHNNDENNSGGPSGNGGGGGGGAGRTGVAEGVVGDPSRELFDACRNGDTNRVKRLVNANNVNAKDTAGRKSSPLHFAAGV